MSRQADLNCGTLFAYLFGMEWSQSLTRLSVFFGAFVLLAVLEALLPDRKRAMKRKDRWWGAWLMLILSAVLARLAVPLGLAGAALWASENNFGLFNVLGVNGNWEAWIIGFLVLDLAVWAQHVVMHKVPFLWRFHRVHHADPDVDVTTALRFHPGEILVSLGWKVLVVVLVGVPVIVSFWFEVILNACAMFNHANMKLPNWLDRPLRLFIVTPAMHRVHHSVDRYETDSNYGFCLSIWDRMFSAYNDDFAAGKDAETGLFRWRARSEQRIDKLLSLPLKHHRD